MTDKEKGARAALDRLADAMLEDIMNASDEAVLAEFLEDYGDPARHAAEMRALFEKKLIAGNKQRLAAARAGAAASAKISQIRPAHDIANARRVLHAALQNPAIRARLTLAARNERELSDADVLGTLAILQDLGVELPDPDNQR